MVEFFLLLIILLFKFCFINSKNNFYVKVVCEGKIHKSIRLFNSGTFDEITRVLQNVSLQKLFSYSEGHNR